MWQTVPEAVILGRLPNVYCLSGTFFQKARRCTCVYFTGYKEVNAL